MKRRQEKLLGKYKPPKADTRPLNERLMNMRNRKPSDCSTYSKVSEVVVSKSEILNKRHLNPKERETSYNSDTRGIENQSSLMN